MATVPILQVLYRRADDIMFGWQPLLRTEAKGYNLYSSSSDTGSYTLVKSNILNEKDKQYKKVIVIVKDAEIPIPENFNIPPIQGGVVRGTTWWFKLTYIDQTNTESSLAASPAIVVRPDGVEPFFENENEVQNNHGFAWVEERHRWEKLVLTEDGKLKVDAVVNIGDITVENVKIAARPDGTTLEYILVDSERKVIVRTDPNSIDRIEDYEEKIGVVPNTETIILTYTNSLEHFIEKIVCSGTSDAIFKLKVDGSTIRTLRNSWNDRNVTFDFSTIQRKLAANAVITVTAKHSEIHNQDYESNLIGFTFTIV